INRVRFARFGGISANATTTGAKAMTSDTLSINREQEVTRDEGKIGALAFCIGIAFSFIFTWFVVGCKFEFEISIRNKPKPPRHPHLV
ncbi:MAG: hypothetical protein ACPGWR_27910, partial [Ardenticatenaceae bacterium]